LYPDPVSGGNSAMSAIRQDRSARVLRFPPRAPFNIEITREGLAWLVIARDHGWLHGDQHSAMKTARELAEGWRAAIRVQP
jgi:hypothetical protein